MAKCTIEICEKYVGVDIEVESNNFDNVYNCIKEKYPEFEGGHFEDGDFYTVSVDDLPIAQKIKRRFMFACRKFNLQYETEIKHEEEW